MSVCYQDRPAKNRRKQTNPQQKSSPAAPLPAALSPLGKGQAKSRVLPLEGGNVADSASVSGRAGAAVERAQPTLDHWAVGGGGGGGGGGARTHALSVAGGGGSSRDPPGTPVAQGTVAPPVVPPPTRTDVVAAANAPSMAAIVGAAVLTGPPQDPALAAKLAERERTIAELEATVERLRQDVERERAEGAEVRGHIPIYSVYTPNFMAVGVD